MRVGGVIFIAALLTLSQTARLGAQSALQPNSKIEFVYVAPKAAKFAVLYGRLKERQVLEQLSVFLSPLNLPSILKIKTDECGALTRVYTRQEGVTICYEFIEAIKSAAAKASSQDDGIRKFGSGINDEFKRLRGIEAKVAKALASAKGEDKKAQLQADLKAAQEEREYVETLKNGLKIDDKGKMPDENVRKMLVSGAVLQSTLYRVALGLLDLYDVPVWGRYTDAADRLAAFTMLQLSADQRAPIVGFYGAEAFFKGSNRTWTGSDFAAVRSPAVQRRFNYLCMAYGANPVLYDLFRVALGSRAGRCADEYKQASRSFYTIISPHIDEEKALQAQSMSILSDSDF